MKRKNPSSARIAFFGTPDIAVYVLDELEQTGILPGLIVTALDKPAGRGLEMKSSAVKEWALAHEIPTIQPTTLGTDDPEMDILLNSEWDVFILAAYGKILPLKVLKIPQYGMLNVHPSLLPKFRGPSPIETAILEDQKETGVTIMLMDPELDHGPILAQASIAPDPWPLKASILGELLAREGGKLLAEVIPTWILESSSEYEEGVDFDTLKPEPQDHSQATFTKKIKKEDGLLDLNADGYTNYLKFCAYEGWPGTFFFVEKDGKKIRIKIIDAEYENGTFKILRVIPDGKREMNYDDFKRGIPEG